MIANSKGSERLRVIFSHNTSAKQSTTATTSLNSTLWVDMKDWNRALVIVFRTAAGSGNITANTGVWASAAATGTSPAAVSTLGLTTAMTGGLTSARGTVLKPGVGRAIFDVSAAQIASAVANGRYIAARVRKKTKANRLSAIYILMDPKLAKASNMTTGNIASTITAP
jgi:hypothetical protein